MLVVVAAAVVGVAVVAGAPVQPSGLNTWGAHRAMLRASARSSAWTPSSSRAAYPGGTWARVTGLRSTRRENRIPATFPGTPWNTATVSPSNPTQ